MRVLTFVCAVAALFCGLVLMAGVADAKVIPPSSPTSPFEAWVDFDLPPEERWVELVTSVIETRGFEHAYGPVLNYIDYELPFGKVIIDSLEKKLVEMGAAFLDSDVFREIQGIFKVMQKYSKRITMGRLVLLNLFYDVTAGCTSVVGASRSPDYCQPGTGVCANATTPVPIHGRNLDFPIPGLNNLTSIAHLVVGGEVRARGVVYAAYVGILTGYRPGGWSVSVNQRNRHQWTHESFYMLQNIYAFLKGAVSMGVFLRDALLTVPSYSQAVELLSNQTLPAPVYLTVAGAHESEGAVLTRNRFGLDRSHGDANAAWAVQNTTDAWWRAETNDDHWDQARDRRRDIINAGMRRVGSEKMTVEAMRGLLYVDGTFNRATTFVSVMSAAFDILHVEVNPRIADGPNMEAIGDLYEYAYTQPGEYLRRMTLG